ncbi:hypothetical protein GLU01_01380 [Nanohaloarchaea archaeon]|jgi:hypothetical protein|nr:hypothetical protein [Candidatus Nanohaloarchaea archaeon]
MVYEIKCSECDKIMEFGGRKPGEAEFDNRDPLPEDATRFNDEVYCRECVKDFVEFGTGEVKERVESLEETVRNLKLDLGFEEGLNN